MPLDLTKLTLKELQEIAKQEGISSAGLTKPELTKAIIANQNNVANTAETQPDTPTPVKPQKTAQGETETGSQAKAELEAQAQADADAQAQAELEAQVKVDAKAKADAEAQAKVLAQAKAELEADTKADDDGVQSFKIRKTFEPFDTTVSGMHGSYKFVDGVAEIAGQDYEHFLKITGYEKA